MRRISRQFLFYINPFNFLLSPTTCSSWFFSSIKTKRESVCMYVSLSAITYLSIYTISEYFLYDLFGQSAANIHTNVFVSNIII